MSTSEFFNKIRSLWLPSLLLAAGIFCGCFWTVWGFLNQVGAQAPWWRQALAMVPGAATLFLVLMARRFPVPYGSGLMLLGFLIVLSARLQGQAFWGTAAYVGLPNLVIGLLFVLFRKKVS